MQIDYDHSNREYLRCLEDEERKRVAASWMQKDTLDYWRHHRMLSPVKPLISSDSTWLTVGDGRYGTDANFILSHGGVVHATDLTDVLLRVGNETGFIKEFSRQNAESLLFDDESFDYVLIKEALHHCPRPWLALYEAFRVCRKAVVLIEPNDDWSHLRSSLGSLRNVAGAGKRFVKKFLGKLNADEYVYHGFEPVGNYLYRFNKVELEKFLLGMHRTHLAAYELNDVYQDGGEFVCMNSPSVEHDRVIKKIKAKIHHADMMHQAGLASCNILVASLFKKNPSSDLWSSLQANGWTLKRLPTNPYRT